MVSLPIDAAIHLNKKGLYYEDFHGNLVCHLLIK